MSCSCLRHRLQGKMILDPANALFKDDWVIRHDVPEDLIEQVSIGVDPSGGEDEVGIVACALLNDGRYAVRADRSTTGSPAQWAEALVRCHDDFDADDVVVEVNFGGNMATEVVKRAAERVHERGERDSNMIRIKEVTASRGKAMPPDPRANPSRPRFEPPPDQSPRRSSWRMTCGDCHWPAVVEHLRNGAGRLPSKRCHDSRQRFGWAARCVPTSVRPRSLGQWRERLLTDVDAA